MSREIDITIENQAVGRSFKLGETSVLTVGIQNTETGETTRLLGSTEFALHFESCESLVPGNCELVSSDHTDSSLTLEYSGVLVQKERRWTLQVSVAYEARPADPVLRKEIKVTAKGPTTPPPLVALDIETLLVPDHEYNDRIGWNGVNEDSPHRLGQPVRIGSFFGGVEHPAGLNGTLDGEDAVVFRHFPIWKESSPQTYHVQSKTAVIGAIGESGLQEAFIAYVKRLRDLPGDQYEIWFNTFWSEPKVHAPGEVELPAEMIDSMIRTARKQLVERGVQVDTLLLDAGWQRRDGLCTPREDTFPDDMSYLRSRLEEIGAGMGVWLSSNGGLMLDKEWARSQGYHIGSGPGAMYGDGPEFVSLADAQWRSDLTAAATEFVARQSVNAIKWDWENEMAADAEIKASFPSPAHLREHTVDGMLEILTAVRCIRPDIRFRAGLWQSPWWLLHADWVFLHESGDYEFASLPSLSVRDRAMTSRDTSYYRLYQTQKSIFPPSNLNIFEFVQGWRMPVGDDKPTWSKACVMNIGRGHALLDLYLSPPVMTDPKWEIMSEAIRWAQAHSNLLLSAPTKMILGNPEKGDVYGFLHTEDRRALCFLRNPGIESKYVDLPVAEIAERLTQDGHLHYEIIYPYRKILSASTPPGRLRLDAGEVLVLQAFVTEEVTFSKQPVLTNCRYRPSKTKDGAWTWDVWPDDGEDQVMLLRPSGESAPIALEREHDGPYPSSCDARVTSRQLVDGKTRLGLLIVVPPRFRNPELWVKITGIKETSNSAISVSCRQRRGLSQAPLRGESIPWGVRKRGEQEQGDRCLYSRFELAGPGENHLVLEVASDSEISGTLQLSAWVRAAVRPDTLAESFVSSESIDLSPSSHSTLTFPGDPVTEVVDILSNEPLLYQE